MKATTRIVILMSIIMVTGMTVSLCLGLVGGVIIDRQFLNRPAVVALAPTQAPTQPIATLVPTRSPEPTRAYTPTETPTPVPTQIPGPTETPTLAVPTAASGIDLQLISEAWNTIQKRYVDRPAIKAQDLTYGAIRGMVEALGDTGHSRFLTADAYKSFTSGLKGEYEGIGAYVESRNGQIMIVTPIDGSPAQNAGILPGDIIVKVDNKEVSGMPLDEVINLVIGPAGSKVTLTILTPSTNLQREVIITRAKITIHSVSWQALPGTTIAHLRVAEFSQGTAADLKKALAEIKQKNMTGIILDLRNNPGGLVSEVVQASSEFLKSGEVYLEKDAAGNIQKIPVTGNGTATGIPLVVMINGGSASGAEITAGALQDAGRAKLIGETTFGTGTVLNEFHLSDGSVMILAIKEWLTPKGRVIWHTGIVPDEEVKLGLNVSPLLPEAEGSMSAADLKASKDAQLLRAIDLLKSP